MGEPDLHAESTAPPVDAVRAQLARIRDSADFAQSARMKAFIAFVVEEALAGRGDRLKEYTIATEVFGRDEDFDPQTNTIVRVEAGRLRRRLERYYLTDGQGDEIRIDLPKGSYVPRFRTARPVAPSAAPSPPPLADAPSDPALQLPSGPSIAVLPFENMSGDPAQEFFALGITEEILNQLTRFADLRVIARHSTFKYKGQRLDIRDVGRELGVRYVLEGSVRTGGNMVRVTGQLIDATDGAHLFSEIYDRDLSTKNILEIQDDISARLVAAVGQPYGIMARAVARDRKNQQPESFEAYDAVLRFYEYWNDSTEALHAKVRDALQRAVGLDPSYASAWAALGEIYLDEAIFGFNPPDDGSSLERASKAAQQAALLDPESSMAYHVLSNVRFHRGELEDFRAAGERAVALNPNHADMLADYGVRLCCCGEWTRGVALTKKAISLSPTHPGWFHTALVLDHYRQGEFPEALAETKQMQSQGIFWSFVLFAMCYGQLGRESEARAACDELRRLAPTFCERPWDFLGLWNISGDFGHQVAEGLRKAGLSIADQNT